MFSQSRSSHQGSAASGGRDVRELSEFALEVQDELVRGQQALVAQDVQHLVGVGSITDCP